MNAHQRRIERRAIARGDLAPRPQRTRIPRPVAAGTGRNLSLSQLQWEREELRRRARLLQNS